MRPVYQLLFELFPGSTHEAWLNHPQARFDGMTALEMVEAGRAEEVTQLLHALADGAVL